MSIILTTENMADAPVNADPSRRERRERLLSWVMPLITLGAAIAFWEWAVQHWQIPHFLIPAPSLIVQTLIKDGPSLMISAWFTVKLPFFSLTLAIMGDVLLGALFALSRTVEMSLFPFAVILQVTPVVAIPPPDTDLCGQHVCRPVDLRVYRGVLSNSIGYGDRVAVCGP